MRLVLQSILIVLLLSQCTFEKEDPMWSPVKKNLMTRWASDVDPEMPLPEYPRPAFKRENWENLNGIWQYAITLKNDPRPQKFDEYILVPFPIESALSGVAKRVTENDKIWYKRVFTVQDDWKEQRLLLHFEAVDWLAAVWLNGKKVGEHRGGYDPFSFEITDYIVKEGDQELIVSVWDPTDKGPQPRGKQVSEPKGIWYTPVSGIWQTVWLEPVPQSFIESIKITPDIDVESVGIYVHVSNAQTRDQIKVIAAGVDESGKIIGSGAPNKEITFAVKNPRLWFPEDPYLYDIQIQLVREQEVIDKVDSYFGMRKIGLGKDEKGITRIMLNNRFVFQAGPLDQGFWPDGIYTAPTDEALRFDIEMTKKLGFNMLRKHVKIENRRFYYWCDKLGVLVWQDMPSGDEYIGPKDPDYVRTKESSEIFEYELKEMIHTLYNHPSIIMWVPFNEGWGQYDTERIAKLVKDLDPSRVVNNASGWTDRGVGDIYDVHSYPFPKSPQAEENRAIVIGEFGGLGLFMEGHTWQKENWGYQQMQNSEDFLNRYKELFDAVWQQKDSHGLSAVVYTQTTDVETETNGLLTYDRALVKAEVEQLRKINQGE